jgi:hypothetical protein
MNIRICTQPGKITFQFRLASQAHQVVEFVRRKAGIVRYRID